MAEATPCSQWELDWREGPARMRKRIRRLSPLEAPNQERLKVRIRCNKTGCFQTGSVQGDVSLAFPSDVSIRSALA